ncbi:MAG: site-specific DNA-methyltransferase [Aestuariivita sp.]|nr:site-specific DNA-methyltransferase [Aestuariivita sp.]MCY4203004.1 site-specific DNA-methyltransferase [Aestuariivita sp.]
MNSASIDLIYLDPPFNSKTNYAAPIGSEAAGAEFKDTWTLNDIDIAWLDLIEAKHSRLWRVIQAAMTDSDKSYLIYMAARLLEMYRLLKPTGSIYLHCDPTMSHYLKLVMDAVFGRKAFQSEVVWKRTASHNSAKRWGPIHDCILHYGGSRKPLWNRVLQPFSKEYADKFYRLVDKNGRFQHLVGQPPPDHTRHNRLHLTHGI